MANFPTSQATELPPRVGPNVPAQLDLRTGEQEIFQALGQLGGQAAQIGLEVIGEIKQAEREVEFSTKKRQHDELLNIGFQSAKEAATQEEASSIWEKAQAGAAAVASDDRRVNQRLTIFKNEVAPEWNRNFGIQSATRKKRDVISAAENNINSAMEAGQLGLAKKEYETLRQFNMISQAQFDTAIKELPGKAALAQARRLIASGNALAVNGAVEILKDVNVVGASTEMLEAKNKLLRIAKETLGKNADAAVTKVMFDMDANKDKSASERAILAEQFRVQAQANITKPAEARTTIDRINKWEAGTDTKTDKIVSSRLSRMVRQLNIDSSQDDVDKVNSAIVQAQSSLSTEDYRSLINSLDKRQDRFRASAIDDSVETAIQNGFITSGADDADFSRELTKWVNAQDKPPTPRQIYVQGAEIASTWQRSPLPTPIFTRARIQRTLGELQVGFFRLRDGTPEPFDTAEAAIAHAIVTLGPNWQTIAPSAASIIKKNFPNAEIPQIIPRVETVGDAKKFPRGTLVMDPSGRTWKIK